MVFLVLLIILILINAYFSAAEIAMVSVRKFRIQGEADKGNQNARKVLSLLNNPDEYLSAIQVGITLVGIIEGLYGGEALQAYLEPRFLTWGMRPWVAHSISLIVGIGSITYVTIILGELLPKSIALQLPQKIALRLAPSFKLFTVIAYPFVKLLTQSTHFILRFLPVKGSENKKLTDADLKSLLGLAYRQGTIEKYEWELHENIFSFYDQTIGRIMTTAEKVTWVDEAMSRIAAENVFRSSTHNYFPVLRNSTIVVGYISAKEFFMDMEKTVEQIVEPACLITADQKAPDLLEKFRNHRNNFGIVVKNGHELSGVVTMHDIGEILIGEFS
jgi:putative hemolysin